MIKPRRSIKMSKKFLEKAGFDVFLEEYKRPFIKSIWMYMIDWRTRKTVNIQKWLSGLVENLSENEDLQKIVKDRRGRTHDETVIHLLRYVKSHISYKSDPLVYKNPEVWQEPQVTLQKRTGDCEDGAILLLVLARLAGIPGHAIQLVCGNVEGPKGKEGHAYITYLPQYDGVPRILDWCYHVDLEHIQYRRYWSEEDKYDDPWFMVNDSRYWGRYRNG